MGIIFDFDLYEFCTSFSERFTILYSVYYLDLYEFSELEGFTKCMLSRFVQIRFDLYDLFGERFSRTNRGIAVDLEMFSTQFGIIFLTFFFILVIFTFRIRLRHRSHDREVVGSNPKLQF